jgi:hypothetical protein
MIGLDKKALRLLEELEALDASILSEFHANVIKSMRERYLNPETTFFTSAQRNLIRDIHTIYLKPLSTSDKVELEAAKAISHHPLATDREKEISLSILGQSGDNPRTWSPKQRAFVRGVARGLRERERQRRVRDDLELALNNNEIHEKAQPFCRSIIEKFDERKQWSVVQMEHAEKILSGNVDPEDIE